MVWLVFLVGMLLTPDGSDAQQPAPVGFVAQQKPDGGTKDGDKGDEKAEKKPAEKSDPLEEMAKLTGLDLQVPEKKRADPVLWITESGIRVSLTIPREFALDEVAIAPPLLGVEKKDEVKTWRLIRWQHESGATVTIERIEWKFREMRDGDLGKLWDGKFRVEWYPELKFGTVPAKKQAVGLDYPEAAAEKGYRHPLTVVPNAYQGERGWQNVAMFALKPLAPIGGTGNVGFF
ncbi:MAG: hypothetical protein AAF488_13855, partial [Planctomycetota bacterium]